MNKAVTKVADLYNKGARAVKIADKLGIKLGTVNNYLTSARKAGLVTRYGRGTTKSVAENTYRRAKALPSKSGVTSARNFDKAAIANGLRHLASYFEG